MAILSFPIADVQKLYDHIMDSNHTPTPCFGDLDTPEYYPNGVVVMDENNLPDASKIDPAKLPRAFHLVKGKGVYLMAGVEETLPGTSSENFVVYAKGMNPDLDDNAYYEARHKLGDDFIVSIPAEWFATLLRKKPAAKVFRISISSRSKSLKL
ncbi:DUF3085 domain-containing protein [Neptuniibacter halophilus]|uniref:DUF3085 domain-containing protein n=1 Tax=Neptuniibacter halophilus TaxID=651666 RepID=UPI0025743E69|nr:DUF3085 domain-containing protein [Neptuniibacter halophilus]